MLGHLSTASLPKRYLILSYGGESEIRTHEARKCLLAFEASAFDQLGHLSTISLLFVVSPAPLAKKIF
jgi:hypothetical protein